MMDLGSIERKQERGGSHRYRTSNVFTELWPDFRRDGEAIRLRMIILRLIVAAIILLAGIVACRQQPDPTPVVDTAVEVEQPPTETPPTAVSEEEPIEEAAVEEPTVVPPTEKAPVAEDTTMSAQDTATGELFSHEVVPCPDSIARGLAFFPDDMSMSIFPALEYGVEAEGETFSCGVVIVPQNYAEPDGRPNHRT